jgi:hypothetical protein
MATVKFTVCAAANEAKAASERSWESMVDLPLIGSWNLISQARQSSTATTKAEGEDMYVKEAVSEDERRDAGQTAGISGPSVGPLAPDDRARSWRRLELGPIDTPYTPTTYLVRICGARP